MTFEQNCRRRPSTSATSVSSLPLFGSRASSPPGLLQISSRPSLATASPSGRPPVSATTDGSPPSGEMRMIRPSSTPVQIWPSASTTTSSGALPGTGMTVRSTGPKSGSGSTGGGCHRTGSTGGFGGRSCRQFCRNCIPAGPYSSNFSCSNTASRESSRAAGRLRSARRAGSRRSRRTPSDR